ncbi:MAG: TonB-dependent receptor [Gammaproteobacteria bacterium]|nr:TonB-dependent receptor [Gammaproteobacteria bacterium]
MNAGNSVRVRIPLLALSCAVSMIAADVRAQSSGAALEEIVVTATRRSTDLQNTPISASVLSGDAIVDKAVFDLYALQYAAPSMTVAGFGSANEFSIRGIGRTQVDIDVPSGVVIYRDGAPTIAGYFQTEPYFDIESVEVLRGPQGTFVGKNAAGGAVFINTNDPNFDKFSARLDGGVGSNDLWEVSGIVNVPVNDTLALRASYKHLGSNDFYDSITGDFTGNPGERNLNSYRAAVKWEPTSEFTGVVKVDYHDLDFGGNVVSSPGFPIYDVPQNANIDYQDESFRVVGDLKYRFDNGITVSSLSAYQHLDTINNVDLNASLPLFYQFISTGTLKIMSQEVNLISPDDQRIRWVVGGLYFQQDTDIPYWQEEGFTFTGNVFGVGIDNRDFPWFTTPWFEHQSEWSVFGHVAFDITDNLELEGGVRYSDYYTDQITEFTFGDGLTPPTFSFTQLFFGLPALNKIKLHEDSVDGQVALNWTVVDDHFLYALFSRGHVPSGINIFPPYRIYDEMDVKNYEVGWKANWLSDQIRTQANFYFLDVHDQHVNFESTEVVIGQDNRNAPGNTEIWGIELSAQAHVGDWHADLAFAYMESDIGKFENVIDPFRTAANGGVDVIIDLSGSETPYTPDITTNIGVAYDFHLTGMLDGFTLTPRGDVSYVSDLRSKLWDTPLVEIEERALVNARLTLAAPGDKWSATFWATNVFDKGYVGGIQNLATLYYAGRPLEYGFRLNYNF